MFPVNRIGFEAGPYYALDGYCSESHLGWRSNMKLLRTMVSTLMILVGAKVLAASQTCQDTGSQKAGHVLCF